MIQKGSLTFKAATGLKARRFVDITASTDSVAYSATGATSDAITLGDEENGVIEVQLLKDVSKSFFFDAEDTIAVGDDVEVGTNGQGRKASAGQMVCIAKTNTIKDSVGTGYNF